MKIHIKTTRLELSPAIEEYAIKKLKSLTKYLGGVPVINCDLELELSVGGQNKGNIFRVEINLQIPKKLLRVEKTSANLYKSIDKAKEHLERMIVAYREKERDKERRQ